MKPASLVVEPLLLSTIQSTNYASFVAALGFESRCTYVAETVRPSARRRFALGFDDRHELAFDKSRRVFQHREFHVETGDDDWFEGFARRHVQELAFTGGGRLLVDISSFTRTRLAILARSLRALAPGQRVNVDWVYSIASYRPPTLPGPTKSMGPVLPEFAGWDGDLDKPVAVVVGLGYEQDRAVGAIEYLEPGEVWAFVPTGADDRYDESVKCANELLWNEIPPSRLLSYQVPDPFSLFVKMQSLVQGLESSHRPVIVPLGPKLFALVGLLVAGGTRNVGVWRVSSGSLDAALDRQPSGMAAAIRTTFHGCEQRVAEIESEPDGSLGAVGIDPGDSVDLARFESQSRLGLSGDD